MLRHKYTTPVCIGIVAIVLVAAILFSFSGFFGLEVMRTEMPYAERLFSTDRVHTLDIVADEADWQDMLNNASNKEYIPVNVVIDGDAVKNIGLRAKGNSSLSSILRSDSDRYSFKLEFDHYQTGQTYYGLDKLALNNIAQDNTYLKDYVSYQMMNAFEADSPLSSFIYITVNGEDWGLYLAVEGIEDAFADRTYGSDHGIIYKPDSMDMAGGNMGGGNMNAVGNMQRPEGGAFQGGIQPPDGLQLPDGMEFPEGTQPPDFAGEESVTDVSREMPQEQGTSDSQAATQNTSSANNQRQNRQGGMFGGMGGMSGRGTDVSLVYTDDEYDSYPNIFDNAVFDITNADKDRLISSLKQLSSGENLEEIIDVNEVLRYFVVHNFVLNFDSYTGSMMHNYYLHEQDGKLSMIAWDYNLAFGAFANFGGGRSGESAVDTVTALVNYPIDTPVSGTTLEARPMLGQLFADEACLTLYHELFGEFLTAYFDSGAFLKTIDNATALIAPYVEKDPTAFCTYEEFTEATAMLKEFCLLRAESVRQQLNGAIPTTSEGQTTDNSAFVDASSISLDKMGSNSREFGGARGERTIENTDQRIVANPQNSIQNNTQNGRQGGVTVSNRQQEQPANTGNRYLCLAVAVLLVIGIIVAWRYKVHR